MAAVSEAGAIGSIGAIFGSADHVRAQVDRVRELTDRPFVVNHVVLESESEDTVRFETWSSIMPPGAGYDVVPRVIRTAFVGEWERRPAEVGEQSERLRAEIMASLQQGRVHELTPFTGQTTGLIEELLPAGEIVRRLVLEAEQVLDRAAALRTG